MTILLTGFEPFGGEAINPSWEVARALDDERVGDVRIAARQLPCVFGEARAVLEAAIDELRPRVVLALGQAAGRCDFSIERVAINIDEARIADNAGAQPIDTPVIAGAPAAYFASLPIKAVVAALRDAGYPASVSHSAGTFVCNHAFFALMHALASRHGVRGGFMHLPLLPEQAARAPGQPSLPLATMIDGVRLALHCAARVQEDRHDQSAGSIA
jgi:pyroglutamyl-peptidase